MSKQEIRTGDAPAPSGAYSQALRAGNFVFVSGQGALDARSGKVIGETVEEQTDRTLDNIEAVLAAAGARLTDVVKSTVHLSDISLFARFNESYDSRVPDPKPARTTVASVLGPGLLVEIDVIAYTETR